MNALWHVLGLIGEFLVYLVFALGVIAALLIAAGLVARYPRPPRCPVCGRRDHVGREDG